MKTEKRKIGDFGENIACKFLMKRGFTLLERNYLKPWGEIDIVVIKEGIVHFVEVKTITRDFNVTRETDDYYRPEENVHPAKLQRLSRTIQTYMLERGREGDWQFDVVVVLVSKDFTRAKVQFLENIVL